MSIVEDKSGNDGKPRDLSEIPDLEDLPKGPVGATGNSPAPRGAIGGTGPVGITGGGRGSVEALGTLEGYVVALVAGKTLLGRLERGGALSKDTLEDVLELTTVYMQIPRQVQGPNGQTSIQIEIRPQQQIGRIGTFGSWKRVEIPDDAVVRDIAEFDLGEIAALRQAVEAVAANDIAQEARLKAEKLVRDVAASRSFGNGART